MKIFASNVTPGLTCHFNFPTDRFEMFANFNAESKFFIHSEYFNAKDRNTYNADYCLFQTPLSIREKAERNCVGGADQCTAEACLPTADFVPGDWCWVAGWGKTEKGSLSATLKEAGLNLMSHQYCEKYSNYIKPGVGFYIQHDEICVGTPDLNGDGLTDEGRDTCQGDSGMS